MWRPKKHKLTNEITADSAIIVHVHHDDPILAELKKHSCLIIYFYFYFADQLIGLLFNSNIYSNVHSIQ